MQKCKSLFCFYQPVRLVDVAQADEGMEDFTHMELASLLSSATCNDHLMEKYSHCVASTNM